MTAPLRSHDSDVVPGPWWPEPAPPRQPADVDSAAAEDAVARLLTAFGEDVTAERLRDTPARVVRALQELLRPRDFDLTTFPNDEGYDELVLVRDIPFTSLCEHHLLPFGGVAHVAYSPQDRIL